jgi:stage II sporulation protein M
MKKSLSVRGQFNEAVGYLKESREYVFVAIAVFILATVVGAVFRENLAFIEPYLRELLDKTSGLNTFEMIFFILQNNSQTSFIALISGAVFGIFPLVSDVINGVVLGYVLAMVSEAAGVWSVWRILPHGIFELPAIFISFGMGIKLGFSLFLRKESVREFKRRFYNSVNVFLMIVLPLLIVAAIIEGVLIGLLG